MKCTMFQFKIRLTLRLLLLILLISQLTFCRRSFKMNRKLRPLIHWCCVTLPKRLPREQMKKCTSLNIWKQVTVIIIETFHHIQKWLFNSLIKSIKTFKSFILRKRKVTSIKIIFKHFAHFSKTKKSSKITLEPQKPLSKALANSFLSPKGPPKQTSTSLNGINT